MNKYGQLIEDLINIKDGHREELSLREIDKINDACNALEQEGSHEQK